MTSRKGQWTGSEICTPFVFHFCGVQLKHRDTQRSAQEHVLLIKTLQTLGFAEEKVEPMI